MGSTPVEERECSSTGQRDKLNCDVISKKASAHLIGSSAAEILQGCPVWG